MGASIDWLPLWQPAFVYCTNIVILQNYPWMQLRPVNWSWVCTVSCVLLRRDAERIELNCFFFACEMLWGKCMLNREMRVVYGAVRRSDGVGARKVAPWPESNRSTTHGDNPRDNELLRGGGLSRAGRAVHLPNPVGHSSSFCAVRKVRKASIDKSATEFSTSSSNWRNSISWLATSLVNNATKLTLLQL